MANNENSGNERRLTPRIKAEHKVVLKGEGTASDIHANAQSIDLNLGGIYCLLSEYMELFTKLQVELTLPIQDGENGLMPMALNTTAVVVRIDPEHKDPECKSYDCALAFVGLSTDAELVLARYMLQAIAHSPN
jgi:hypothetical protein